MAKRDRHPHANTRLAKYLRRRILELSSRKTQLEIARAAGFINPNVLSMIKSGANKLPLDRVPALAEALECDPARLFLMTLEQSGDTKDTAFRTIFGTVVTRNEKAWLEEIREASGFTDPGLTSRARSAIRGIFGK